MRNASILLLASLAFTGCAAKGPLYTEPAAPPPGYAQLILYRQTGMAGAMWTHSYYIDRTLVAQLRVSGYTTIAVKPGNRIIHYGSSPDDAVLAIQMTLEPGEAYYVKEGKHVGLWTPLVSRIEYRMGVIPAAQASQEIIRYRYQPPLVDVFDGNA
jgi:hypothetical protein